MSIRYTVNLQQYEKMERAFDDPSQLVASVVKSALAKTAQPAIDAIGNEPRPAVHPFRWSLNPAKQRKARNYYFAAIARGEINTNGSRYIRTGRYKRSFDVAVRESANSVDAVFGSDFQAASYIAGDETGNLKQVPGHATTGWSRFVAVADEWANDTVNEVRRQLPDAIEKRLD